MSYYIDQLAEQDRMNRLADLLAMQQDARDLGAVSTGGGLPSRTIHPQGTLGDLIPNDPYRGESMAGMYPNPNSPQRQFINPSQVPVAAREGYGPAGMVEQAPENMIRNNSTGRVFSPTGINGQPSQSQSVGLAADWSRPVDVMGAKGHWASDNSGRIILRDGRIVDLGRDTGAERARTKENLALEKARADIAHTQTQTALAGTKPDTTPAGYRKTATGNLEAIPGGPADQKIAGQYNADIAQLQSSQADLDRLATSANELLKTSNLGRITGIVGALPNIPGMEGADAQAKLNTLKSQVGFGVLQAMRNASKTGGALGNVSDAEGKRLEANLAALENAQSEKQMRESLQKIVDFSSQAKDRLSNAFNMRHNPDNPSTPGASKGKGQQTMLTYADGEAIAWAMKNPTDPRAAAIKAKLGVR